MTVRRASTLVETDTTVTTTTETEAAEVLAPVPNRPGLTYTVSGWVQMTVGTGGTAVTPRIRRGTSTAGTLVGEGTALTVTAGDVVTIPITVDDVPGEVHSLSYVVTVEQTGATADGTVSQAHIETIVNG